jgi:transposase, IS5 family
MHAILCGAGHNLRLILAHLRVLLLVLFARIFLSLRASAFAVGSPSTAAA